MNMEVECNFWHFDIQFARGEQNCLVHVYLKLCALQSWVVADSELHVFGRHAESPHDERVGT